MLSDMISALGRQANPSDIERRCPNCRPVAIFEYDPISRASSSDSPESPVTVWDRISTHLYLNGNKKYVRINIRLFIIVYVKNE